MKKRFCLYIYVVFILVILLGCSKKEEETVTLEIWHYYNGAQKIAFDQLLVEFNETLGLEKGIIIEAFSQSDINHLERKILEAVDEKVGGSQVPNMITTYPEIAYILDQKGIIVNLQDYIGKEEISQYVDSYVEEGRLGEKDQFKIFPIAKATEVLMVNKTDWDKFAADTGAKISDLETWEGISKISELYYKWTDSLTEEKNDGKAFFGRDSLANYMLVGSKQLGKEIFQVKDDEIRVNLDPDVIRKLWDNYYIPYINGYYKSYGRYRADDAKIGEIIALVGSTTGATYFPRNVTIGEDEIYGIELLVLPLPNFRNTNLLAVQQGAGMSVLKSDQAHEEASVEFLKWFTEDSRNLGFSIETGYLPVKKASYESEEFKEQFKKENIQGLSKELQMTIPLAMDQIKKYQLYTTKAFKEGREVRAILRSFLEDKAKEDRKKVIELLERGLEREEAVEKFTSDENFQKWFLEFQEKLIGVVENED